MGQCNTITVALFTQQMDFQLIIRNIRWYSHVDI
jgi:hypothetical protein